MPVSVFSLIHQNQTLISTGIAITISICTFISTILTVDEVKDAEMYAGYVIYKKGLHDGILKTPKNEREIWNDELVQLYNQLVMIRKITTSLGFIISALHLISSIWAIYKKSKMSIQVWLVVQAITLAALLAALLLPMMYKLQSVLMLKIFYAVISVDIFLTVVLFLVVFLDLRSGQGNYSDGMDETASLKDEEKYLPASNTAPGNPNVANTVTVNEEESLPAPPPPPPTS